MKKPALAKANAEELGHSGSSPIRRPPEGSRTLCHMLHNSDLATAVAESCPHKGAARWIHSCVARMGTRRACQESYP